jgi:hypothetical protein
MRPKKPYPDRPHCATISQPEICNDRTSNHNAASAEALHTSCRLDVQETHVMRHRPPAKLPDPWLFDSEKLLRELDRCRKLVLQIPIGNTHATHFGINIAVDALWNLRDTLRHLLLLHREAQHAFAQKAAQPATKPAETSHSSNHHSKPASAAHKGKT